MGEQDAIEIRAELLRQRSREGDLWIATKGTSMGNRFAAGTEVLVRPSDRPRLGEVWVYCAPDGDIVAHRYFRRSGDRFVFRGDARNESDPPVRQPQLVGKAVRTRTNGRDQTISRLPWLGLFVRAFARKLASAWSRNHRAPTF